MRFFVSGGIAMILSWLMSFGVLSIGLTGCRFGNHIESADKISGYYRTEPALVTLYAEIQTNPEGEPEQRYGTAPGTELPSDIISTIFGDPVGIMLLDIRKPDAVLFNPVDMRLQLPVQATDDGTISAALQFEADTFWRDPACLSEIYLFQDGALKKKEKSTVTTAVGDLTVFGRLEMSLQNYIVLSGECEATLQSLYECYQDRTTCGGEDDGENEELQAVVRGLLEPYFNTAVFTTDEISKVKVLAYEAQFR